MPKLTRIEQELRDRYAGDVASALLGSKASPEKVKLSSIAKVAFDMADALIIEKRARLDS